VRVAQWREMAANLREMLVDLLLVNAPQDDPFDRARSLEALACYRHLPSLQAIAAVGDLGWAYTEVVAVTNRLAREVRLCLTQESIDQTVLRRAEQLLAALELVKAVDERDAATARRSPDQ
jgi:hypothetical protein